MSTFHVPRLARRTRAAQAFGFVSRSEVRGAELFFRDLVGQGAGRPRRALHAENLSELADPVADTRLRQVMVAALQADAARPLGAAAYLLQVIPPRHSDPSRATERGSSLIDAMLRTVTALRTLLVSVRPGPTPRGLVKLALSDEPGRPARDLIDRCAKAYGWNVEVVVPEYRRAGLRGRAAMARALRDGKLAEVLLTRVHNVTAASVVLPGLGREPCAHLAPDQVTWYAPGGVLHIDVGGEGVHADAANLNFDRLAWGTTHNLTGRGPRRGDVIPNLVCGNALHTWPIGDRKADKITIDAAPIHPSEVARVIKSPGKISISTTADDPQRQPELVALRAELGGRLVSERRSAERSSTRVEIDVR